MSCPNFISYDAKRYNVIDLDIDDYRKQYAEDEYSDDELYHIINMDYEDILDSVAYQLENNYQSIFGKKVTFYKYEDRCPIDICDNNYGVLYFGTLELYVNDKYTIQVHAISTSGYSCGITLDYILVIKENVMYYDNISKKWKFDYEDEFGSDRFDECKNKQIVARAEKLGEKLENKLYKSFAEQYVCLGVFSNGEAVYKNVE